MYLCSPVLSALSTLCLVGLSTCSWGDSSPEFRSCLRECIGANCTQTSELAVWEAGQSLPEAIVGWTCQDDCGYMCMWKSAAVLYNKYKKIPQYYGRWPFLRILGCQEPASVLFSVLNLLSHVYMVIWFVNTVPSEAPMYRVWIVYSMVSMNAWIWSAVFHTRDTPLTEMLDYFCAFSTVLFSLLAFVLRILHGVADLVPRLVLITGFLGFYCSHVVNMATVRFDYGYNMKVNVLVGGLNCASWLVWFYLHRSQGGHLRQGATAVLVLTLSVSLELLEFTPILWSVDSHALWHLVTSPLPLLWYKFTAGDCLLLLSKKNKKFNKDI